MTKIDINICPECGGEISKILTFIVNADQSPINLMSNECNHENFHCTSCDTEWLCAEDIQDDWKVKQEEADERESKGTVRNH